MAAATTTWSSSNTQTSTQWDGFRHVAHPLHGHYGGVADEDHGIHHWAERGIVGRAVVADVGRWREAAGRPLRYDAPDAIEPEDVTGCLADAGVAVETGDVLLVRTGWLTLVPLARRRRAGRAGRAPRHPRPAPRAGHRPDAVGPPHRRRGRRQPVVRDVAAGRPLDGGWWQRMREDPEDSPEVFVHTALLGLLGLPIGELWDLDALAEDCAADGRYEAMLTSAPLHLRAGAASPPNALAIR